VSFNLKNSSNSILEVVSGSGSGSGDGAFGSSDSGDGVFGSSEGVPSVVFTPPLW
jgi:hypothetical protein